MEKVINNQMGTMDIKKLALKTSMPMVISMISIALYGIVDTIFISNISEDALTAVSLASPIQSIIIAIALGMGIGVNSILAKTLGEKNNIKVNKIILHGLIFAFLSWCFIFISSICGLKSFFKIFTDNKEISKLGYEYLSIISIFSIGSIYQVLFEKILEAHGKSKESMIVQISGAIINLILDPILIFGLLNNKPLGIKGAAISTIIGQFVGMLIGIFILIKYKIFDFKNINLKIEKNISSNIYKVGFPTTILELLSSIIVLILNKVLISFSESAVSLWGIYCQLQKFALIIIYGLNYGMIPIVAYNWGANLKNRIKETINYFLKLAIIISAISMVLFFVFPKQIISLYDVTDEILQIGVPAFRILSCSFIFAAISLVLSAVSQAFGNGTYALIINLSRKIILVLPIIFIFKNLVGMQIVWYSFLISEFITMIIAFKLFKNIENNIINKIEA